MKIADLMSESLVYLDIPGKNKSEVITNIIHKIAESHPGIKNIEKFIVEVLEREKLGSTGIGDEVAIPHARTELVDQMILAFARTENEIDFEAIDNLKVRFIFLMAVPTKELKVYLTTLANISRLVKSKKMRQAMRTACTGEQLLIAINNLEEEFGV